MELNYSINHVLNIYPFVNTLKSRDDPEFIKARLFEHNLMSNQRSAVSFCKNLNGIKTSNIGKISQEDKDNIVTCMNDYFVEKDPNYFGKRDVIYLDLWE